ncbi:MAG: ABC transporter substrate-binding protein [Bryobacteraceae bacterium]
MRIVVSRHSAFYSPLIATLAAGFLEQEGLAATYRPLAPGERAQDLVARGEADVVQSAVSSSWLARERGESSLPVHFAQINCRDGFFLVGRQRESPFEWKSLEGRSLLADHAPQPLAMLQYASFRQGVRWDRVEAIDAGTPEQIADGFRAGRGDYAHLQGPAAQQLEHEGCGWVVALVGEAMPPVAFSSLLASRSFLETSAARAFLRAYVRAREWVRATPAREVAAREACFFPGIAVEALCAAIERYQALGCWEGGLAIPRDLYEQALDVFLHAGLITRRWPYEEVVLAPPWEAE